jgi:hypothetical protein
VIHLDVIFGTPVNFRKEKIEFEVVDWPSQYHAILGRPAFARFMAVPHYAYLKLRMPANRGLLTISGSFARSENYDKDFNSMSQPLGCTRSCTTFGKPLSWTSTHRHSRMPSNCRSTRRIHPTDPTKMARVSNSLSPA